MKNSTFLLKVTTLFLTTVLLSFFFVFCFLFSFILFFVVFLLFDRRDSQGTSAISYIVRATSHLLDPRAPEFTASFVGRLVTTLIKNVRKQDFSSSVISQPLSPYQPRKLISFVILWTTRALVISFIFNPLIPV